MKLNNNNNNNKVEVLIDAGAKIEQVDRVGNDPLMTACGFKRLDNVKYWFSRFQSWNVRHKRSYFLEIC